MNLNSNCLPENIRRAMPQDQRQQLGKNARTMPQIEAANNAKSEKKLQGLIGQYLRQRGIVFICPPMNRKSTLPEGWADFTFAWHGEPIAFECKAGSNKQSDEQHEMQRKMELNGWRYFVITELDQVRTILNAVELKGDATAMRDKNDRILKWLSANIPGVKAALRQIQ